VKVRRLVRIKDPMKDVKDELGVDAVQVDLDGVRSIKKQVERIGCIVN
jgi:hypothetical protein